MTALRSIPLVPAGFFGIVLGLAGLGGTWRAAHQAWGLPETFGEVIMLVAAVVWAILLVLYMLKWVAAAEAALAEIAHPVQCCFVGLIGVATMLVAGGAAPHAHGFAVGLYIVGFVATIGFAVWRTGGLWLGGRDHSHTTPVLYLPTVAGTFVAAPVGAMLGYGDWGQLAFGAGLFSWLAIESVLLHRLLTEPGMASALRPTLGIQLAPPVVGAVALLSVAPNGSTFFCHALIGYGLLQCLVLLRLLPWIMEERFTPSYWAFTFGVTALATAPLRLVAQGDTGAMTIVAPIMFVFANSVVVLISAFTVFRVIEGRLLPSKGGRHETAKPAVGSEMPDRNGGKAYER
ncbi:dicarboxylate transporter/tellurite-resistance protein TehA [Labrys portucalensis]|uniref:Dicarboxylate transporter/tellurite-resistance protein TehA n=1 Tax=Labrys neptuniae TaxID=376174 RepID=A0ABV6ZRM0_9HYPH